jgi:hypothetical protein
MFEDLSTYQILMVAGSLIGIYIKLKIDQNNIDAKHTAQIGELRLRLKAHEDQTDDIKRKLETLIKAVEEIKLLLASNQIK